MTTLSHIAARVLNRPLMITPQKAQVIAGVLGRRIGVDMALPERPQQEASRFHGRSTDYGYFVTEAGVAVIPIIGTLVNRGAWIGAHSGLVSYEGLDAQIRSAAEDGDVRAILLDMDTPGGEAAGAFELPALIREVREHKPVVAFANDMAASAGYAIASAASEIVVTQTGEAGSIGVVMLHLDHSGMLEQEGVVPTFVHAGAHKVDGNPFEPLPDTVRTDLQAEVDRSYALFVETVAAGRPQLSPEQIRATEARIYAGTEAVEAGLADRVDSFAGVLSHLTEKLARSRRVKPGRGILSNETKATSSEQVDEPVIEEDEPETAAAQEPVLGEDAKSAPRTQDDRLQQVEDYVRQVHALGRREGSKAARERIAAILDSDEARGREDLARKLAFGTDIAPEEALTILKAAPKAATQNGLAPAHIAEQAGNLVSLGAPDDEGPVDDRAKGQALAERFKTLRVR